MSEIPSSWCGCTIADLFSEIKNGTTQKQNKDANGIPVTRIETIQKGRFDLNRIQHLDGVDDAFINSNKYEVGDIAFSHINSYEHVGKTAIYKGEPKTLIHGMNLLRLRPFKDFIDPDFLYYQLNSKTVREEVRKRVGHAVNQVSINQSNLREVPLSLAPLNEQKRIVAKLDELLPKVEACKERLQKIPTILKRFRQSVLAAAVSGKLTDEAESKNLSYPDLEWVERPEWASEFSESWKFCKLGAILDRIEAGKNFNCLGTPVSGSAVGLVKISAVTWDEFDPGQTKTVTDPKMINPKLFISSGDLLVTRANTRELVGASVIVRDLHHQIMISDKVWRIHLTDYHKGFLHLFLKSSFGRSQIEQMVSGNQAAMFNISQKAFSEIIVPFPPLTVQKQIYKSADLLLLQCRKIADRTLAQSAYVERVQDSILKSAFSGTLVFQHPSDEPASTLLERIKQSQIIQTSGKPKASDGKLRRKTNKEREREEGRKGIAEFGV